MYQGLTKPICKIVAHKPKEPGLAYTQRVYVLGLCVQLLNMSIQNTLHGLRRTRTSKCTHTHIYIYICTYTVHKYWVTGCDWAISRIGSSSPHFIEAPVEALKDGAAGCRAPGRLEPRSLCVSIVLPWIID